VPKGPESGSRGWFSGLSSTRGGPSRNGSRTGKEPAQDSIGANQMPTGAASWQAARRLGATAGRGTANQRTTSKRRAVHKRVIRFARRSRRRLPGWLRVLAVHPLLARDLAPSRSSAHACSRGSVAAAVGDGARSLDTWRLKGHGVGDSLVAAHLRGALGGKPRALLPPHRRRM